MALKLKSVPNFRSFVMGTYTLIIATIAVVGVMFDPTRRLYMWMASYVWGRPLLALGGIKLVVKGGEKLDASKSYIVCANHSSQMDIPVIFAALGIPVRFMAKKSIFYVPIFGWSMWLAGFIPVDRSSSRKARESINEAAQKIKNGPSLLVFPEGTRSPDGEIHSFKSGAFVIAQKAGVPILPVAIRGSHNVLPKDTVRISPGTVEFVIGTPISTTDSNSIDKEKIRQLTKSAICEMFETGNPV